MESVKFVLQKLLSLNPFEPSTSAVEEALVLAQAVKDVRDGVVPLTVEEAVHLASLRIQVDHGDQNFRKLPTYDGLVEPYVPAHIIRSGDVRALVKALEAKHGELKGKGVAEANAEYLEIIRGWRYHGSTHFRVSQTFSNELPKDLILAINFEGVHVFRPYEKVSCVVLCGVVGWCCVLCVVCYQLTITQASPITTTHYL